MAPSETKGNLWVPSLLDRCLVYGEELKSKVRFKIAPLGVLALPTGLFAYGWTAQYEVHWIVPILGMTVVGAGKVILFMSITLYLVESFEMHSASAPVANTVMSSALPLIPESSAGSSHLGALASGTAKPASLGS
ncbi:hypothetical protein DL768_004916 [Monosporascus sp. mg162]|nr:hypothetical protein DL768_004916 [Monosporascus sp. mg162]